MRLFPCSSPNSVLCAQAGTYQMNIMIAGQHTKDSPYNFVVKRSMLLPLPATFFSHFKQFNPHTC